jgi:hypothetical protein
MRANLYSRIRTLEDVVGDFSGQIIPAGTLGTIVEAYENPEGYAVDLEIRADTLVGNYTYENVILLPEQFEVCNSDQGASDRDQD